MRRERDELLRLERQKHQDYLRRQQQEEEERRRQQGDDAERANMMSQVQGHLDKKVRHHCTYIHPYNLRGHCVGHWSQVVDFSRSL